LYLFFDFLPCFPTNLRNFAFEFVFVEFLNYFFCVSFNEAFLSSDFVAPNFSTIREKEAEI